MPRYPTTSDAWRVLCDILADEPFSITHTIMHGGKAGVPVQWVEIDYKGNVRSTENFDKLIEIVREEWEGEICN